MDEELSRKALGDLFDMSTGKISEWTKMVNCEGYNIVSYELLSAKPLFEIMYFGKQQAW
tara:strand:+ start:224 stop:400 length:177 start_codon:yes stop_codon:yes gene_type:complete